MKITKVTKPPEWSKHFKLDLIQKVFSSAELQKLIKKAEHEYMYWDKFKYHPQAKGFSAEEAWSYLKFTRLSNRENSPARVEKNKHFSFTVTKTMFQKLSFIDSNTSGFMRSQWEKPSDIQKSQLIVSSLSEEAIASSQIEGASTSRKVAKTMILSKRKPRTRDEQMIINNFQVMQRLLDWKDLPMSQKLLLKIQADITKDTLENQSDSGRLRKDEDKINIIDRLTGEVVFVPPVADVVKRELERFIDFANTDESEENFIHPVIKACILHFWLAYLHPFVDGNGRTARAVFYWYLLRKNYWMFQYLAVSRVIKSSKSQYDRSFLYVEFDDNDLSYSLSYMVKIIVQSIDDFIKHYKNKIEQEKVIKRVSAYTKGLNIRQVELLQYIFQHNDFIVDIYTHQSKNAIAYQTARTDIFGLVKKGFLTQITDGKQYQFIPNNQLIKKLFSGVRRKP